MSQFSLTSAKDPKDLADLVKKAVEWYNNLSPEEKEAHDKAQCESWIRGEMGMGSDADEAAAREKYLRERKIGGKLRETLGGIQVPWHFNCGDLPVWDNLAIALCTYFENPDQDSDDETCWTPDAIKGTDLMLDAIHAHYHPYIVELRNDVDNVKQELTKLREAVSVSFKRLFELAEPESEVLTDYQRVNEFVWAVHKLEKALK